MSVVLLVAARSDYANVGGVFVKCLNEVGVTAYAFSRKSVSYNPTGHAVIFDGNLTPVVEIARKANAIIWMHSLYLPLGISCAGKKLAVFHGGSVYRRGPGRVNRVFNPKVHVTLTQTAELLGKGAKNEVWMLPAAYIDNFKPNLSVGKKVVVGHFPSAPRNKAGSGRDSILKGSYLINDVMEKYGNVDYNFSPGRVDWKDNLTRMAKCDIYVESLNQASKSTNKHDWSVAALEAAALGCVVVTNFGFGEERYKREYGEHALQVANTKEQFVEVMDRLVSMSESELVKLKNESVAWANSIHGLRAIGRRLKGALGV